MALTVRDRLVYRWAQTQGHYQKVDAKRVYYLSAEFLMGPQLGANLLNLGLVTAMRASFVSLGA